MVPGGRGGGGEYIETDPNDRNVVARMVRDGEASLRELVSLGSLLHSSQDSVRGGSAAGDNYKLASLLIEFLRESDFGEGKFEDFLYTLGKVRRGDLEEIEAGFLKVYGATLLEVEQAWRAYCKAR